MFSINFVFCINCVVQYTVFFLVEVFICKFFIKNKLINYLNNLFLLTKKTSVKTGLDKGSKVELILNSAIKVFNIQIVYKNICKNYLFKRQERNS